MFKQLLKGLAQDARAYSAQANMRAEEAVMESITNKLKTERKYFKQMEELGFTREQAAQMLASSSSTKSIY